MFLRISSYYSLLLITFLVVSSAISSAFSWGVFNVKYKFAGRQRSLFDLRDHDSRRQLRILAGVDLPLGGSGRPDGLGLYYAKIGIGTPSKDYYVQVDTGSDLMWVNCIQCKECPKRSSLGIDLTLYNIKDSATGKLVSCDQYRVCFIYMLWLQIDLTLYNIKDSATGKLVSCDQEFCYAINGGPLVGCMANQSCPYLEIYGDGSSTAGYFVEDIVLYDRVSGDLETSSANGSVIFGCGATQSGNLDSSNEEALDGILGFGKSNSSMISQLASSGNVKKIFAHCLDGVNGGGIFAIGHVVQPKVNMTPLVSNQPHYNVNMTAIQVGHDFLNFTADLFESGDRKGTIIDSGTTLAYLPEMVYEPFVSKNGLWCIGWQNSGMQSRDRKNMTLLGDLVLSNKLVLYDLENQAIGWTEYNCSSSIQVLDERTGTVHLVGSHYISSACRLNTQFIIILILLATLLHYPDC
ncbi:aspartic proteinase-like protein 2 isoform X3 [Durio zibethinus]|uniref:Aspartic proteinase-like protein 2 isoform X3 n=1 Tax=Durio zibethinus TaxID=66656 RepID=A0A6P5X249_DURZI|nr:aspartic proteinase-like protein 2 isoform X3 [Durio zibethinus]